MALSIPLAQSWCAVDRRLRRAWPLIDRGLHRSMAVPPLGILLLVGCAEPERTLRGRVAEDSWETLAPSDVQVRVGRAGEGTEPSLVLAQNGVEKAAGTAAAGSRLPIVVGGVACELVVDATFEDSSTDYRPSMGIEPGVPKPQPRDLETRSWRGVIVTLGCGDEPVPGSDASLRGARPWPALLSGLPGLALGFVAGLSIRPQEGDTRLARAFALGLLALAAAMAAAGAAFQAIYALTYGALFVAWAVAGMLGGRLAEPRGRHTSAAWTLAALAGPLLVVAWRSRWGPGMPIAALAMGGALAAVAVVIAVSLEPTY
ncbi:MAG: hypothetical protein R3B72_27385 [Polyangiaceae bacterium]